MIGDIQLVGALVEPLAALNTAHLRFQRRGEATAPKALNIVLELSQKLQSLSVDIDPKSVRCDAQRLFFFSSYSSSFFHITGPWSLYV